jgi:excisionase family DNA binding protein
LESDTVASVAEEACNVDEVMTIRDVAEALKLAEKTVYAMANEGEIPAFKIRGQWRIRRTDLDRWLDAQSRGVQSKGKR